MKKYLLYPLLALFVLSSCKKTEEQLFESAVNKYNKKHDQKSTSLIADRFLQESKAVALHKDDEYISGINSIIVKNGNISRVITCDANVEEWGQEIAFSHYLRADQRLMISDGISAELYQFSVSEKGERQIALLSEFRLADSEKSMVRAMFFDGGTVYYVKNLTLYSLDITTKEEKKMLSKELSSPVKISDAKVFLKVWPGIVTVAVGNGGLYTVYVIRAATKPSVIKQLSLPSHFISYSGDKLMFITGKTGHWKLSQMDIVSGKMKDLRDFPELRDIRTSGTKVFIVEGESRHITDAAFEREFELNNGYAILDKMESQLLVKGEKGVFAVSTDDFFSTTEHYEQLIPGFFERKTTKTQ